MTHGLEFEELDDDPSLDDEVAGIASVVQEMEEAGGVADLSVVPARPSGPIIRRFRIYKQQVAFRLDKFLQQQIHRISRTNLQKWIKQGEITVNGLPTKASYEPREGDLIQVVMPPPPPTALIPEKIPLDILFEDRWILILNKPAGIVCHPAFPEQTGTIANAVAGYAESLSKGADPFRAGIVHRLDKNTTGLLIVAKTDEAHWRIAAQFERRTVKKQYFAVCVGRIELDGDVINQPLAPAQNTTERMVLPGRYPPRQAMFKEAVTQYKVNTRYLGFTSVDLFPKTGRTHQLRVHLAGLGHPIVGDRLYGGPWVSERDLTGGQGCGEPLITYQALHARKIRFMHPILETPVEFEAPLSGKIARLVGLLEQHRQT